MATRSLLIEMATRMVGMANRLDRMVEESRWGGWSTHHSSEHTQQANDLRRWASQMLEWKEP